MSPEASPISTPTVPLADEDKPNDRTTLNDDISDEVGELITGVTETPLSDEHQDSPASVATPTNPEAKSEASRAETPINPNLQVRIRAEKGKIWILLPPDVKKEASTISYAWSELIQQIQQRLNGDARTWAANTPVRVMVGDRLLDTTQIKELIEVLEQANLRLKRFYTSRRQTAVAVATSGFSVEQHVPKQTLKAQTDANGQTIADPLYIQMTLRSGAEIRHDGSVIVMGDMNPGSSVIAEGDILVWGKLRGTVHAGSEGNAGAIVMATQMQPAQIRIADFVARGPSTIPSQFSPEVAYVTPQGKISIAPAQDFIRP